MNNISIVIPTYNRPELVKNTLLALDNQEKPYHQCFQVILVDDGSDVNTLTAIDLKFENFTVDYLYLPRDENSCRSKTRNAGLKCVLNDIVVFLDDDIIVKPDFIKEITRGFSLYPGALLIGLRRFLRDPVTPEAILSRLIYGAPNQTEYRYQIFNACSYNMNALRIPWNLCWTSIFAAPRLWLHHVGGFDENFKGWGHEDVDLALRLYQTGLIPVLNYRIEGLHQYHKTELESETGRGNKLFANTKLFFEKHPGAFGMTREDFIYMCDNDIKIDYSLHQPMNEQVNIFYRTLAQAGEVKKKVRELSQSRHMTINLYDEVEDSDLDIWAQLLKSPAVIRYFPRSMRGMSTINVVNSGETMVF